MRRPSAAARDYGSKVDGYFRLASVQHDLIVSPEDEPIVRCRRGQGDVVERRLIAEGVLRLEPPGLEFDAKAFFAV